MLNFLATASTMFVTWFILSGQINAILLTIGVVSSLFVAYWSHDLLVERVTIGAYLGRVFRLVYYLPWLFWQIVLSNIHVIHLILRPQNLDPGILRFKNELKTELGIVILANSITLTPGTVTIEANHQEYVVHYISKQTAEGLLSGEMQARVKWIESGIKEANQINA